MAVDDKNLLDQNSFTETESSVSFFKNKRKQSRLILTVSLVLTASSIALSLVVLLVAVRLFAVSATQENDQSHKDLVPCVPCLMLTRDLSSDIDDDPLVRKLTHEVKDGEDICCAYNSTQMSTMFEAVSRRHTSTSADLPSYNVSDFMFSPVSAHKRIYPKRIIREFGIPKIPERPQVSEFNPEDRYGIEHHRGVNITQTGLQILHGGLYYVYASIQFRPQSTWACKHFQHQVFTSRVVRYSPNENYRSKHLLKVSHTCCDNCVNTEESRFTGGLFILDPGDVIQVWVMGYELVHFQPHSSFAGLAMLGNVPPDTKQA